MFAPWREQEMQTDVMETAVAGVRELRQTVERVAARCDQVGRGTAAWSFCRLSHCGQWS